MTSWKLSPSDLTFLWDECPRCFYLKVVRGFNRPASAFPSIFGRIDRAMKTYYADKTATDISASLPAGKFYFAEQFIVSTPLVRSGFSDTVYFSGKFDAILEFDNGSYGLIDFKTSEPKAEQIAFYARQLQAYVYALENPAPGKLRKSPVTHLGLLYFSPHTLKFADEENLALHGTIAWRPIIRDDAAFMSFIDQVLTVLTLPEPPEASPNCTFCQYRRKAREFGA
jgi:hypothetical protein